MRQRERRGDEGQEGLERPGHVDERERPHRAQRGVRAERVAAPEVAVERGPVGRRGEAVEVGAVRRDPVDEREVDGRVAEHRVAGEGRRAAQHDRRRVEREDRAAPPPPPSGRPRPSRSARGQPRAGERPAITTSGVASSAVGSIVIAARASTTIVARPSGIRSAPGSRRPLSRSTSSPQPSDDRGEQHREQKPGGEEGHDGALAGRRRRVRISAGAAGR